MEIKPMTTSHTPADIAGWPPLLRRADASRYLARIHGLSFATATLAKLAVIGGGPAFQRCGKIPLYNPTDLDAWAQAKLSKRVTSTSELRKEVA
jgi:hypothetical protein